MEKGQGKRTDTLPTDNVFARKEYIERETALKKLLQCADVYNPECSDITVAHAMKKISAIPAADVVSVPNGGIGEMSDGYHTFNGLYYQRMVLFAALVKAHKDKAWKSWKHEDGELCFGGGWFIVGIDTPEGSYTYHYEDKDWNQFDCVELPVAKHWDGHTEEDVTRLLSLDAVPVRHGRWVGHESGGRMSIDNDACSECGNVFYQIAETGCVWHYCPNCGARMDIKDGGKNG